MYGAAFFQETIERNSLSRHPLIRVILNIDTCTAKSTGAVERVLTSRGNAFESMEHSRPRRWNRRAWHVYRVYGNSKSRLLKRAENVVKCDLKLRVI